MKKTEWICPICKKNCGSLTIMEYAMSPKTTLFGKFKAYDWDGNPMTVNRRTNAWVCSEECKQKNENQYFVEEYKGNKIYCVDGRYMPYLECDYWFDSIEGVQNRIDNPHLVPLTPALMDGLKASMSGEPGNI